MTTYRKEIEVTDTGMVIARVWSPEGRRVGLEFFGLGAPLNSRGAVERRCKKAHRWVDARIQLCLEYETK